MILWQKECGACKAKDQIISFLEKQIDHLREERNDERAEYKRTVDILLIKNDLPPAGQGVDLKSKEPSVQDILKNTASIFEEVPVAGENV